MKLTYQFDQNLLMGDPAVVLTKSLQSKVLHDFALVRHVALNLLKTDRSFKGGIKRKHKQVNRSDDYRETIVLGLSSISS
jgi:hypothetical protein